jgi:hypothetical protein
MAASPNQTKQNGRNQTRVSHSLAIKSMPLSLSVTLGQLVQTKPNKMAEIRREFLNPHPSTNTRMPLMAASSNQTKKMEEIRRGFSIRLPLQDCLSLSLGQLVQTKSNKIAEIRRGYPIPLPLQECISLVMAAIPNQTRQNSGNQTMVSHPFAITRMHLSR